MKRFRNEIEKQRLKRCIMRIAKVLNLKNKLYKRRKLEFEKDDETL